MNKLPKQFITWITAMFASYEDRIVSGMIKKGYAITAGLPEGQLSQSQPNNAGAIISFVIIPSNPEVGNKEVFSDIIDILFQEKVLFYSVVVSLLTDAIWIDGNIQLPLKPVKQSIIIDPNKGKYN